ncbi:MAG TPA: hypothetical protein DEF89_25890 [Desulfosporosinus sp.]|nr:hypothetical protein [Desulfosporosinus sp.]
MLRQLGYAGCTTDYGSFLFESKKCIMTLLFLEQCFYLSS